MYWLFAGVRAEPASPKETPAAVAKTALLDSPFAALSAQGLEVVDLIASGYSKAEIADILAISPHTVNDHTQKSTAS